MSGHTMSSLTQSSHLLNPGYSCVCAQWYFRPMGLRIQTRSPCGIQLHLNGALPLCHGAEKCYLGGQGQGSIREWDKGRVGRPVDRACGLISPNGFTILLAQRDSIRFLQNSVWKKKMGFLELLSVPRGSSVCFALSLGSGMKQGLLQTKLCFN